MVPIKYSSIGFQKIAGAAAATSLTLPTTVNAGKIFARISVETQPIRYRDDGSDPTGTDGLLLPVGTVLWYDGPADKFRFIQTAASTVVQVLYYIEG